MRSLLLSVLLTAFLACGNTPSEPDGGGTAASPSDTTETGQPACTLVEDGFGPDGAEEIGVEVVVEGLEVPWGLAFVGDGDMLVTERPGRIRLVQDGALVEEPVATIAAAGGGEGGLLGLAAHPDFDANRSFYVYFTTSEGGSTTNRVERWQLADDGRSATRERVILDGIPAATYHNGGRLRFGPDDMLYVGTGDARDPQNSQDRSSLAGKLLRVAPDGEVPDDNPFPGSPVYLTGIRNTQGFAWPDASTVWLTDHGPSGELGRRGHDEVSVASAGDDLGWPDIYGCQTQEGMVAPSLSWQTAVPPGGADIYRGDVLPGWDGSLVVGTLGSRHLHRVVLAEDGSVEQHGVYLRGDPPEGYGRLREVMMGPDGAMYVTTSNCDGRGSCPTGGDKILRLTR